MTAVIRKDCFFVPTKYGGRISESMSGMNKTGRSGF